MSGERFRLFNLAIPGTPQPFLIRGTCLEVLEVQRESGERFQSFSLAVPGMLPSFFIPGVGTERPLGFPYKACKGTKSEAGIGALLRILTGCAFNLNSEIGILALQKTPIHRGRRTRVQTWDLGSKVSTFSAAQPEGLRGFWPGAFLLVGQRPQRVFSLLAPHGSLVC